jgi:hypothetical protein
MDNIQNCDGYETMHVEPNFRFFYPDTRAVRFVRNDNTALPDYTISTYKWGQHYFSSENF